MCVTCTERTNEEFERDLDRVKEAPDEPCNDEIMHDEGLTRNAFHQIGTYDGLSVFQYDEHGSGIRHQSQLDRIFEENNDFWVVPADVHLLRRANRHQIRNAGTTASLSPPEGCGGAQTSTFE